MADYSRTWTQKELAAAFRRLGEALDDWRPFWERWRKKGKLKEIQTRWFRRAAFDPPRLKEETIKRRRRGMRSTDPSSSSFYKALGQGSGSDPKGRVGATGPKWLWTKNTLRSTFEPQTSRKQSLTIDTEGRFRLHQSGVYGRFGGPFAKYIFRDDRKLWDLKRIDSDLEDQMEPHFVGAFLGEEIE